ncbi:MAG TPA: slipin family protein [Candidatus Acetothermia bacterium]|nr:slipin family protein [Candidatus Acetothermia bacterium]
MTIAIIVAVVVLFLTNAIRVVREYERGVIFRLGRLVGAKGPGLFLIIPLVDKMVKVDLRTITLDVPPQEVITRDNVPVSVNAVVYFRVVNPQAAVVEVLDYIEATRQISMTTLRSVLGRVELDDILAEREKLNRELQQIIDEHTDPWGIKVSTVEIKDVKIPTEMQRAIARQAEAERERRSKVINAEGEFQAAEKLREAAAIMRQAPGALQLRYLQTLSEISTENATTIVFPVPIEILDALRGRPQG